MFNNKKLNIIVLSILYFIPASKAQLHTYNIAGDFNKNFTGKVYLIPAIVEQKYYNKNAKTDSATVNNGKFVISRKIYDNGIYPYRIIVRSNLINGATNLVFLSNHNYKVTIDSLNEYISPIIRESPVQNEMKYGYDNFFAGLVSDINNFISYINQLDQKYSGAIPEKDKGEITSRSKELSKKGDSLFFEYAKTHTDSYVTLWKLIERFKNIGYKKEYSEIYNLLSKRIKNTTPAICLLHDLQNAKALGIGSSFPRLELRTENKKKIRFNVLNNSSNYTLVDFWFSGCVPCLQEFPKIKLLYNKYKNEGFEVIGISVDNRTELNNWKKVIKEHDLSWINYLDQDGTISKKLSINSFPSNFLLNNNGKIIKKNISTKDLQTFLSSNLRISDNIDLSYEPL